MINGLDYIRPFVNMINDHGSCSKLMSLHQLSRIIVGLHKTTATHLLLSFGQLLCHRFIFFLFANTNMNIIYDFMVLEVCCLFVWHTFCTEPDFKFQVLQIRYTTNIMVELLDLMWFFACFMAVLKTVEEMIGAFFGKRKV